MAASIENSAASAPPVIDQVICDPASGSAAVRVVAAVVFSLTDTVPVGPPPADVITGASLVLVTVTLMVWLSVRFPSETCTVTS